MAVKYKKRIADEIIDFKLATKGAVLIEGAKWCGKTTTAEQHAKSCIYMSDPAVNDQNMSLAALNPQQLLKGKTPRLIDEWQLAPTLWDAVRFEVDHRGEFGQFLLTGSAVPPETAAIHHTGTGRFSWLRMRPMALCESGESTGEVSLKSLFDGTVTPQTLSAMNQLNLKTMAYLICRGGWPQAVRLEGRAALSQAYDYVDAVARLDVARVLNQKVSDKNENRLRLLLRSYARYQGSQTALTAIQEDLKINSSEELHRETLSKYIDALKQIFVIEDMPAWNPNLRSKTAVRTTDTRYFVDPSIAAAALRIGPQDLLNDLPTCGFLFETLCVRDLRVIADALDGNVYHFRDKNDRECDAVVHLRDGRYGLIEVKLGGPKLINEGASNLLKIAANLDTAKMKAPSFLMVLTAVGQYAYYRNDNVLVVPIGCLGL